MPINTFELLSEITEEIKKSNDRGCVILAASFFDELLGNILNEFLIKDVKSDDEIFTAFGPLSTFSAKVKMSYRLGLISVKEYKQLDIFRKIRNKFAHQLKSKNFADSDLKDLIDNLRVERELVPITFFPLPKTKEEDLPILELTKINQASPREIIDIFILYMCNNLFGRIILAMAKPSTAPAEFKFFYEPFELASENIASNIKKIKELEVIKNEKLLKSGIELDFVDQSKYEILVKVANQMISHAKMALNK
jgi:DNA-binding MltR family transcriptional regulator